ncbi:MAG: CdvA-like protein [Candidatus Bathyarchaeia archaeon]
MNSPSIDTLIYLKEGYVITSDIDYSMLIGQYIKDENGREIGKIHSFLIDSMGQIKEALIENKNEDLVRYPVERLKIDQGNIFLISDVKKRVEILSEKFPIVKKKKEILDNLSKNNEILPEVYEKLAGEFNKALDEMRCEAQNLSNDLETQIRALEDSIKTLHLARTFLEMEHGINKVEDEVYQQSLMSILKEIKNLSYRKLNLTKDKEKISILLLGEGKTELDNKKSEQIDLTEEKHVITVHVTEE